MMYSDTLRCIYVIFTKLTLLLIYCVFVGINNKLYAMHGTHIKIGRAYVSL